MTRTSYAACLLYGLVAYAKHDDTLRICDEKDIQIEFG